MQYINKNMTILTTPTNNDYQFEFSKVNTKVGFSTPKTYTTKYEYDLERKLKKITYPSGKEIENIYNKTLLTSTKTAQGVTNFEYDCLKNISKTSYKSEIINYSYDGTLLKSLNYTGALSKNINFDYNNNFQISKISYANRSYNLTYDNDQLLKNIGNFAISRNSNNGLITSISDGKLIKTRTYNSYGEINQTSDNIFSYSLKRDKNGKIIQKTETISGNQHIYKYSYDDNGRLIEVKKDDLIIETYGYDENGNRNGSTVNEDDQTLTYKNINYTYNSDGYLILKKKNSKITSYKYGIYGELKKVRTPTKTIEYEHNANHQRVVKKINGEIVEKYLWLNLTTLLAIYGKDNNLIQQFEYADQRMPINMIQNGKKYYLHYDQIGTVKTISDENLQIVKKIEYDSYGNILNDTNQTLKIPFGFAGGLYDPDTDLTRFGFRDYDSYIGKWTAKDPIDFGGGDSNLYGYVLNDPINFIDPRGLVDLNLFKKGSGLYYLSMTHGLFHSGYTVGAHGPKIWDETGKKSKILKPKELIKKMKNNGYKKGDNVSLLSCESGNGKGSYAQKLANELDVTVYAPTGYYEYGFLYYRTSDEKGMKAFHSKNKI